MTPAPVRAAMSATFWIFGLNGLVFASWAARIPAASAVLDITPGQTGSLLLVLAVGSVLALPLAGGISGRIGTANTVRIGGVLAAAAALTVAAGLQFVSVPLTAAGLFLFGVGVALWDVAQNIEGADVERRLLRTVMPQFHAAFSGGAFVGALAGAVLSALGIGLPLHLLAVAAVVVIVSLTVPRSFLPHIPETDDDGTRPAGRRFAGWGEGRTLLLGVVVLGAALTEGAANDWLAKATVDGLGASESVGALMFGLFVAAMTAFRFVGARFIDRFGRVPVLRASLGAALAGLLLFVLAPSAPLAAIGAVLWGAGAALGFPVGMSAAADDPAHASARVSVVSTIGYVAFLAGPPLLGFLGDRIGIRNALLTVAAAVLASALLAPAAREASPAEVDARAG